MKPSVKATSLFVTYSPTGERMRWRFWREPRLYSTETKGHAPAWCWEDETGYVRVGPATWAEFVPYLRQYFHSYNCTPLQDFN